MKSNPNVQKIVKGQDFKYGSSLSPFTIVENNVVGMTESHLVHGGYQRGIGKYVKMQASVKEKLSEANWQIMAIQNDLKRIVDNGELHMFLSLNAVEDVTLFPKIPKFFAVELKEFENPMTLRIRYKN